MDIQSHVLTNGFNSSSFSSLTTASISPGSGRLILVAVVTKITASDPNTPTMSGCGLTWTQVATVLQTGSQHVRLTIFRAMSLTAITPGALTISFSGQNQDSGTFDVTEYLGVLTTGTNGANAIVQIVTSNTGGVNPSITLSAFAQNNNANLGIVGSLSLGTTYNPQSGFSQIFSQGSAETVVEGALKNTSSISVSWTQAGGSSYPTAAVAMELAVAPSGGAFLFNML